MLQHASAAPDGPQASQIPFLFRGGKEHLKHPLVLDFGPNSVLGVTQKHDLAFGCTITCFCSGLVIEASLVSLRSEAPVLVCVFHYAVRRRLHKSTGNRTASEFQALTFLGTVIHAIPLVLARKC